MTTDRRYRADILSRLEPHRPSRIARTLQGFAEVTRVLALPPADRPPISVPRWWCPVVLEPPVREPDDLPF